MHPNRRRKKRPNYGIRTVEVMRGPNGFGFTISGQQPCILSCIVNNSPADQAGLRAGDFLISVNGVSVSKMAHDSVVGLIGNCVGPIKMTIAENYYSDSSDEELECSRMVNVRKPKHTHKPRSRVNKADVEMNDNSLMKMRESLINQITNGARGEFANVPSLMQPVENEAGPVEYKALVGYLGTIEMPKQLLPNSRLQTVCSCIRKLRQEKRTPTAVLMTILPTCLTLKNASNHILAIYPTNRVVYVSSTADRESRYFGLVTSAVCDTTINEQAIEKHCEDNLWQKTNNPDNTIAISNSCHVFVTDPKIIDHSVHQKKAESFRITCTPNAVTGYCQEFPCSSLYIVSLIQNMYKLQNNDKSVENHGPLMANSPQPSASSNSDSGIGFRDDCGNISDRILVVEFPAQRPLPFHCTNNRPSGIDASNIALEGLDLPLNNVQTLSYEVVNKNTRQNGLVLNQSSNLSTKDDLKCLNNLSNVRACDGTARNESETSELKSNDDERHDERLTCRAMPDTNNVKHRRCTEDRSQEYAERPVDVPDSSPSKKSFECVSLHSLTNEGSVDNISTHSSKSNEFFSLLNIFKVPFESRKPRKQLKMSSLDNLDKYSENVKNYKLSPKVYGLSKPTYSCEELNGFDGIEKCGYGSLQDLWSFDGQQIDRGIAQSEPDVRISRNVEDNLFDQNGFAKCSSAEGPAAWAQTFEKLLEDTLGLHMFAEFLKKEFSAENIYFWTACERFKNSPPGVDKQTEARRIYEQHLSVGAPEAVNVDSQGRQYTEQYLQEINDNLFDQAQKQIFNLMKFDSYPRFLKSDIYKQCLSRVVEKVPIDVRLLLHQQKTTHPKLKKSASNAEDRRRKSLLPWHRKNRSKSKDRGEIESTQRDNDEAAAETNINNNIGRGEVHSNGSSLTSLDLAVVTNQDSDKQKQPSHDEVSSNSVRTSLCRVILSNGSTTVVQIKESETIQELVSRLLEKRGLSYSSFEVYTNKHPKSLDVNEPSSKLAGCEVTVEQRVVFKLDLPNRKTINIRSKYTKIITEVLRPSLHKYQYNLDQVVVMNGTTPIDLLLPVTSIDGLRLKVIFCEDSKRENVHQPSRMNNNKLSRLEEITNKVFESILQEKSDCSIHKPSVSEKGSVKSEDWGSEHSSTFIGKFLRRDSGVHDRRKKIANNRYKGNGAEDIGAEQCQIKKPLVAKLKAGANKLHVTCSESDELVEGLSRAQRRLEDQRGTEINFELPDFLKDKENEKLPKPPTKRPEHESNTRFYLADSALHPKPEKTSVVASAKNLKLQLQSNYENRSILVQNKSVQETSAFKSCSDENSSSNQSTPTKSSTLNETVIENKTLVRHLDPPPLPPKPKIVPIRPANWGQVNSYYKPKEMSSTDRSQALFLEQTSSSFV